MRSDERQIVERARLPMSDNDPHISLDGRGVALGPWRVASGTLTASLATAGLALSIYRLTAKAISPITASVLPLGTWEFRLDNLGAIFLLITSLVGLVSGIYSLSYFRVHPSSRTALASLPLFLLTLQLVPTAGNYLTFWYYWEAMALVSAILVLSDHHDESTRRAGLTYLAMTQFGFALILTSTAFLNAIDTVIGRQLSPTAANATIRSVVFVISFVGFSSKAGQLPFHAWLAKAHPAAPTPVSALMSAAMVNLGIYGIIRVDFQTLGVGPKWWGALVIVIGTVTAAYSALHALSSSDIKVLLAWSTSENMGFAVIGIGTAMLLRSNSDLTDATVALSAAFAILFGHCLFKSLAFISAGGLIDAAGSRDINAMGGLAKVTRSSSIGFAVAALSATGLPLGAGFIGEWLLIQSLIHSAADRSTLTSILSPIVVAVLALTIGLATTAMVKAFGISVLGRPRRSNATHTAAKGRTFGLVIALGSIITVVFSFAPQILGPTLILAVRSVLATTVTGHLPSYGVDIRLLGDAGSVSPSTLAAVIVVLVVIIGLLTESRIRRVGYVKDVPGWRCGGDPASSRMQYNASSFAQPLEKIFERLLAGRESVTRTHLGPDELILESLAYSRSSTDVVASSTELAVLTSLDAAAATARLGHQGRIRTYLLYGAIGLIIVLVVAR